MTYYRKIIKIKAEHSPNVKLGLAEAAAGASISHKEVCPGVLTYAEYLMRRKTWDPMRQCVGLDAEFYEGPEQYLFPREWLEAAQERARLLQGVKRDARAMGIDPAEGGDNTAICVVDRLGVLDLWAEQTRDTTAIIGKVKAMGQYWGIPAENWVFDRGGGGKEHADRLWSQGFECRSIAFGEGFMPEPRIAKRREQYMVRKEAREDRYAYKNKRAEMYGELSLLMDPNLSYEDNPEFDEDKDPLTGVRFAIPSMYKELIRQLSLIPRRYDDEGGKLYLPSKGGTAEKRIRGEDGQVVKEKSLIQLIGHSPDEADACVLAVHGLLHPKRAVNMVGAAW